MLELEEFSKRLRQLRWQKKMNQSKFAKAVNIPQGTISLYERGTSNPSLTNMLKIANAMNVSLDWLAGLSSISPISCLSQDKNEVTNLLHRIEKMNEDGIPMKVEVVCVLKESES